jgi:hypothetical protein
VKKGNTLKANQIRMGCLNAISQYLTRRVALLPLPTDPIEYIDDNLEYYDDHEVDSPVARDPSPDADENAMDPGPLDLLEGDDEDSNEDSDHPSDIPMDSPSDEDDLSPEHIYGLEHEDLRQYALHPSLLVAECIASLWPLVTVVKKKGAGGKDLYLPKALEPRTSELMAVTWLCEGAEKRRRAHPTLPFHIHLAMEIMACHENLMVLQQEPLDPSDPSLTSRGSPESSSSPASRPVPSQAPSQVPSQPSPYGYAVQKYLENNKQVRQYRHNLGENH